MARWLSGVRGTKSVSLLLSQHVVLPHDLRSAGALDITSSLKPVKKKNGGEEGQLSL